MTTLLDVEASDVTVPGVPTQLFIGGQWKDAADGRSFEVIAPATEERLASVSAAGEQDVDAAVKAARGQVDGGEWANLHGADRGRLLRRLADLIERDFEHLVALEAMDVGRPAFESRAVEIPNVRDVFDYFAGWADKIEGRWTTPAPFLGQERRAYTIREPLGVIGAIIPWNLPTMIASWKLAPALAAGNAVVLKPAEDACLTSLYLAKLVDELEFPGGAVNVIPGLGLEAGSALVRHQQVDKLSFTGSVETGREIGIEAARRFCPVTLELGGKSPQIVFDDVNVDEGTMMGMAGNFMVNQGQLCSAGSRIFVHRSAYESVLEGLSEKARGATLGEPFDEQTTMGSLINAQQLERVTGYIERGTQEGAELVTGGRRLDRKGFFVEPTIFTSEDNRMTIAQEEIFGPVCVVLPFDDFDEVVRQANDTRYGLAAFIWTSDVQRAHELASRVRAGAVWINGGGPPDARVPWGGTKSSGLGRELGWAGIEANTEEKSVIITL